MTKSTTIQPALLFQLASYSRWDAFVLVGVLLSISALFYFSGALFSGYNLIDDHLIYEAKQSIAQHGFWSAMHSWVVNDLHVRTRPVFMVLHVAESHAFTTIEARAVASLLWLLLTILLTYILLRRLNFSILSTVVLVILIFVGRQTSAWVMIGTQERYGMLFLVLCLWMALLAATTQRQRWLYQKLFVLFLWITAFSKESFLLLVPLLLGLLLSFTAWFQQVSIRQALALHGVAFASAILLVVLTSIFCWLQLQSLDAGYAGIGRFTIADFFYHLTDGYFRYKLSIAPFVILLLLLFAHRPAHTLPSIRLFRHSYNLYYLVAFMLMILSYLPQVFIYTQTGFVGRYFMPAEFFFWLSMTIPFLGTEYFSTVQVKKVFRIIVALLFAVFVLVGISHAWQQATLYGQEGKNLQAFFQKVATVTTREHTVLLMVQPDTRDYEKSQAIKIYFERVAAQPVNVRFCSIAQPDRVTSDFDRLLVKNFFATYPVEPTTEATLQRYPNLVFMNMQDTATLRALVPSFKPHAYIHHSYQQLGVLERLPQ